jgi:hypothetical protein
MEETWEDETKWNTGHATNQGHEFVQVIGANTESHSGTNNCQKQSDSVLHPLDLEAMTTTSVTEKAMFHDLNSGEQHKGSAK